MHLNQSQQAELQMENSLGEKLKVLVGSLPSSGVTVAEIRDLVGQDGLLVFAAFLTIVFMVPVSIPGVSTVFGAAILLIGISRLLGCNLWLPKRIAERILPADKLRSAFNRGSRWLDALERVSRPHRQNWLVSTRLARTFNNCAMIAGAILLMAPFGLIPFSNTLPALAILFLSIGLLQRDGLCILYGHLLNLATVVYFAVLILGGGAAILEVFRHLVR
ncbi:MAG: exopolysaccharide biosynthesis protein [Pirellulales bacterium]|nr:exopolysaccharide biosynthesis protein [Pirellulales bacterium]